MCMRSAMYNNLIIVSHIPYYNIHIHCTFAKTLITWQSLTSNNHISYLTLEDGCSLFIIFLGGNIVNNYQNAANIILESLVLPLKIKLIFVISNIFQRKKNSSFVSPILTFPILFILYIFL